MHVVGKVFLGIGAVLLVLGIVMGGLGGSALEDVGDVDVEGKTVWNGQDGTFYYDGEVPNRNMSEIPHPFIIESIN